MQGVVEMEHLNFRHRAVSYNHVYRLDLAEISAASALDLATKDVSALIVTLGHGGGNFSWIC